MAGCGLRELREIVGGGGSRRQEPRSQLWATGQARPRLRGRHSGRLPPAPPREVGHRGDFLNGVQRWEREPRGESRRGCRTQARPAESRTKGTEVTAGTWRGTGWVGARRGEEAGSRGEGLGSDLCSNPGVAEGAGHSAQPLQASLLDTHCTEAGSQAAEGSRVPRPGLGRERLEPRHGRVAGDCQGPWGETDPEGRGACPAT